MNVIRKWWFSLLLSVLYVAVFLLWQTAERRVVVVSGLLGTTVMLGGWLYASSQGYFRNRVDALLHALIVVDVLLEGLLVTSHDSHGFYLCALAFAIVVAGYRHYSEIKRANAKEFSKAT
jgi:hypothetical protein